MHRSCDRIAHDLKSPSHQRSPLPSRLGQFWRLFIARLRPCPSRAAKSKRVNHFLLLELLIGLSLTALLLSCLFAFWVESVKVDTKLEKMRTEILQRAQLQTRLQDLFTSLVPGDPAGSFYTQEFPNESKESLIALFDNGIDPDPSFSGAILARIYLDEEQNLTLALWPKEDVKNRAWRKEILLPHVTHIEWEFLGSKRGLTTPQKTKAHLRSVNASLEWRSNWPLPSGELPALIRLSINHPPLRFAFRLPAASATPTYIEGVKA